MAALKVIEYRIAEGGTSEELSVEVNKALRDGWDLWSVPCVDRNDRVRQAMVKRFDPHAGKVWLKLEGKQGRWVDPETAALAREASS